MDLVAAQATDKSILKQELQAGSMAKEEKIDDLQKAVEERENQLEDMDLNNLTALYPLYQLQVAMQAKEEEAMRKCQVGSELDDGFDEAVKPLWSPDRGMLEVWDAATNKLSTSVKLQKKLEDWILEARLQQLMSQRRDEELQEMQQKQISRPPDPLDIEEADDAEWKTSKAFKYLWAVYGEKAKDAEAFFEEMIKPKSAVPFLRSIFFDSLKLSPGVIETDIEASVDLEQLPSHLQKKVAQNRLFRVTDREVDCWRFIADEASDDQVWKCVSGDIILNATSEVTDLFRGSVELQSVGDKQYLDSVTGNFWMRFSKGSYYCTRGIWFDAFVDVCNSMGMPIGRTSSWIIWNLVTNEELMRPENIDLIMCQEVRLLAEIRGVSFNGQVLQGNKGSDSSKATWSLLLNSDRIGKLRAKGRAHPRPDLLEEDGEEAAKPTAKNLGSRETEDSGSEVGSSIGGPDKSNLSPGSSRGVPNKSNKHHRGKKGKKRLAEKLVKINTVKVTKLQTPNLIFLEHVQDTLTFQLVVGDRVEGVGCLELKHTHEEVLFASTSAWSS
mmetsp:Transcript_77573/g.139954  ORF Transcript_77573/g.139954 Transcript_77573/m.139954 type:complete len:555 (-) Transcript_77573:1321-2985(-)